MEVKTFRNPLTLSEEAVKVAICSPSMAIQIWKGTSTPRSNIVERYSRKSSEFFYIEDPEKDPDHAKYLIWINEEKCSPREKFIELAKYADYLGEVTNGFCPKKIEMRDKTRILIEMSSVFENGGYNLSLKKSTRPFIYDTEVKIFCGNDCPKMNCRRKDEEMSEVIFGISEGYRTLWVRNPQDLISVFYGALLMKAHQDRMTCMNEETEEGEIYKSSPERDSLDLARILEEILV